MHHTEPVEALLRVVAALAVAALLTPVVRSVTIGLEGTLGRTWPFSLATDRVSATPGCEAVAVPDHHAAR